MMENERSTAINPTEAVEEKVSLSDRFGLWLGFHKCSQDDYLAMVAAMPLISARRSTTSELQPRGARMGDDARRALRPRRLAVRPGSRRDGSGSALRRSRNAGPDHRCLDRRADFRLRRGLRCRTGSRSGFDRLGTFAQLEMDLRRRRPMPVMPAWAMVWPRLTVSPRLTVILLLWA